MDTRFCERHRPPVGAAGRRSNAREKRQTTAFIQAACVIVNVHREQARSYRGSVVDYFLGESTRVIRSRS
ncbi:hypothetical protein D3C81_2183330 [compost metagenome]